MKRVEDQVLQHTLFDALAALLTVEAGVREPLDTNAVAKLDRLVLSVIADGYDDTDTLHEHIASAPSMHQM